MAFRWNCLVKEKKYLKLHIEFVEKHAKPSLSPFLRKVKNDMPFAYFWTCHRFWTSHFMHRFNSLKYIKNEILLTKISLNYSQIILSSSFCKCFSLFILVYKLTGWLGAFLLNKPKLFVYVRSFSYLNKFFFSPIFCCSFFFNKLFFYNAIRFHFFSVYCLFYWSSQLNFFYINVIVPTLKIKLMYVIMMRDIKRDDGKLLRICFLYKSWNLT